MIKNNNKVTNPLTKYIHRMFSFRKKMTNMLLHCRVENKTKIIVTSAKSREISTYFNTVKASHDGDSLKNNSLNL